MPCRGCKGRFDSQLQSMARAVGALSHMIHSLTQHAERYKGRRGERRQGKRGQTERRRGVNTGQEGGRENVLPRTKSADESILKTQEGGRRDCRLPAVMIASAGLSSPKIKDLTDSRVNSEQPNAGIQKTMEWEVYKEHKILPAMFAPSNTGPDGVRGRTERELDITEPSCFRVETDQPVKRQEKTEGTVEASSEPQGFSQTEKAKVTTEKRNGSILLRFPGKSSSLPSDVPSAESVRSVHRPDISTPQQCLFCGYFSRERHMAHHFRNVHQGMTPDAEAVFWAHGFVRTRAQRRRCPAARRPPNRVLAQVKAVDRLWLDGPR